MATYKRRLIPIVDWRFQFKYTGIVVLVAALVSAALGYFLLDAYFEMNAMIEISQAIGDRLNTEDARRVFYLVIGFLGLEVILLGVLGLVITHRVCGPIFVLHRHLATLLDGRYPELRPLRRGDEFRSTFETFSSTVQMLKERDEEEAKALRGVLDAARSKGLGDEHVAVLERLIEEREARRAGASAQGG